jgi:hypothetical protein
MSMKQVLASAFTRAQKSESNQHVGLRDPKVGTIFLMFERVVYRETIVGV